MPSARKPRGASAIGVLIGMSVLVAVITLVLRLGPHYLDWRTMKTVFESLPVSEVHSMSKKDIREVLRKQFRVNSLRDFDMDRIITIERNKTETVISVAYERREPIAANVDAVLTFSEQFRFN